ncbi:MAG: hypothetical protein LBJ36_10370 [Synergistaceae bacterium]|jgi:chromosome segregation ATPase|nr:hypothetical protein [Synergistaceae bacterium]
MLTVEEMQELNAGILVPQEVESFPSLVPIEVPIETNQGQSEDLTRKLNDITQQYNHLSMRYKHVLEERDEMSTQIAEFRRRISNESEARVQYKAEALRLLGKLVDEEHSLRESVGSLPADGDLYARHNKFVKAFFNLMPDEQKMP